ncbi:signal peptidase II [Streptococcus sp. sy004]|uniref:signal peptidase II n=1 Tax=Streptococcus sp. sy004 TaxID=2600149 RepID=UPI0011B3E744|nr:signal peptidase II [Streptococcus sp. sy004]TWT10410.1 signal peptidase II [Streptococcus sp. sy004]
MRKVLVPLSILLLLALDQVVKFWVVAQISLGQLRTFLPGLVSLTYLRNYGAAFSMLQNQQILFFLVTFVVIGGAVYYLYKQLNGSWWQIWGLVLIIAGGLGNFVDRLRQGYVVDMFQFDFVEFAIFNVADIYLTFGVLLLLLVFWREENEN